MNSTNHIPYTWAEIENQLRVAIACQASILDYTGPKQRGFSQLYAGSNPDQPIENLDQRSIVIERYGLYDYARAAYLYAYQIDGLELATSAAHYEIANGVLNGFPQTDMHGEPSPLCKVNDFPLRRMFETFLARWELYELEDWEGQSVRALSLLSNMTIPAVRTSLSKEGLKLEFSAGKSEGGRRDEDKAATLNTKDALDWLSRRRGFIANRNTAPRDVANVAAEIFANPDLAFDTALQRAMTVLRVDANALAGVTRRTAQWVETLRKGGSVEIDVAALRAMARALNAPEPEFVARAVKHLIGLDLTASASPGA